MYSYAQSIGLTALEIHFWQFYVEFISDSFGGVRAKFILCWIFISDNFGGVRATPEALIGMKPSKLRVFRATLRLIFGCNTDTPRFFCVPACQLWSGTVYFGGGFIFSIPSKEGVYFNPFSGREAPQSTVDRPSIDCRSTTGGQPNIFGFET